MSSLFNRMLSSAITRTALGLVLLSASSASFAVEKFWNIDNTPNDWLTGPWALTEGGTFNQAWVAGDSANFTANSQFTLTTAGAVVFSEVTVNDGVIVTASDADETSPFSTGGGTGILDVGAGGVLDLGNSIEWDNAAGTALVKNGTGVLSLRGSAPSGLDNTPYSGGFTLNAGTVILRSNDSLGRGPLTINGGTIAARAGTRTVTNSSIAINGDFTIGGTTTGVASGDGEVTRVIHFSVPTVDPAINLGGANRTITIGNNVVNSIQGDLSNGGVVLNAATGATGTLTLSGANTYAGGTTITGGTLSVANNQALGTGMVTLNGGRLTNAGSGATGTNIVGAPYTLSNPIHVATDSLIKGGSTANVLTLAGPITGSAVLDTNTTGSHNLNYTGDISGFTGTFKLSGGGGATNRMQFIGTSPASLDGSQARFVTDGANTSTNQAFRFGAQGSLSNPTIKLGSLSGTHNGGTNSTLSVNLNSGLGNVNLEVGHLGLNDTLVGGIGSPGGTVINLIKVGTGTMTFGSGGLSTRYLGRTIVNDGVLVTSGLSTGLGFNPLATTASQGNMSHISPLMISSDAGTVVNTGGTVDLNGGTYNEVFTINGAGFGSAGALVNNNTTTGAVIGNGVAAISLPKGLVNGTGYDLSTPLDATISGGGGSGATLATGAPGGLSLGITDASIDSVSGGSGFAVNDLIRLEDAINLNPILRVTSVDGGGAITGVTVVDSGAGYSVAPSAAGDIEVLSSATGDLTGFTLNGNANNFTVASFKLIDSGTGYTSVPTVTITGGGAGTGAVATALLSEVKLASDASIGGAGSLTIDAVVSGSAGLTKVGAGVTTLNGLNTYTGDTEVQAGTLSIAQNGTLFDSATVSLLTGAILDLQFSGTDTINALVIDGNSVAAGTWGAAGSGAANVSPLFAGIGVLNVLTGAAGQMGDFNNDGIVNLADYTVWRDNLGGPESALNGNGSGNATVGSEDYALWKTNFGAGSGSVQALGTATVPEPSSVVVLLGLLGAAINSLRNRVS